eukprot:TRINITY_DN27985_c1_g1_i1.p2 TRINITY_DN27985_c1_g1~~TRINITY_DN27985_c1_g1_i1.p2  ORF type:complete len:140 (-),score=12.76 TRINITY_DN27985_c1_g1_i1:59-436(-)
MPTQLLSHPAFQQLQQTAAQQQQQLQHQTYEAQPMPAGGEQGQDAPSLEEGQQQSTGRSCNVQCYISAHHKGGECARRFEVVFFRGRSVEVVYVRVSQHCGLQDAHIHQYSIRLYFIIRAAVLCR